MYIKIAIIALAVQITIAVVIDIIIYLRNRKHPSSAMYNEITGAIAELQNTAIENVITEENEGYDPDLMGRLNVTVKKTIRIVYTVHQHEEGFLHTVSSQLTRAKGEKYHIGCMLIMLMILESELELIGVDLNDARFQINQSEFGTLYIEMPLTPGEHNRFSRKVKELFQQGHMQKLSQLAHKRHSVQPVHQTSKKKQNIQTWQEPQCVPIEKAFTIENLRYLLEDGTKGSNAEFTHQQITDWCARWNCEIYNDQVEVPTEIGELIFDVDAQWDMNLFNTYSLEELNKLDFTQIQLPTEWFQKWTAELKNLTEQPARL